MLTQTAFSFKDGKIGDTDKFDFNIISASIVEGIKIAVSPTIVQNKLSGKISIEINNNKKTHVTYAVIPKESTIFLQEALSKHYTAVTDTVL